MGLFKAGVGAFSSALADQWREYFYCDALPDETFIGVITNEINTIIRTQ